MSSASICSNENIRPQSDDISIARQMKGAMEPMGEADGIYI